MAMLFIMRCSLKAAFVGLALPAVDYAGWLRSFSKRTWNTVNLHSPTSLRIVGLFVEGCMLNVHSRARFYCVSS